jgi:hypothetical protein
MSQIPSIVIVVVFMVSLSLILNFVTSSFLEIVWHVLDKLDRKRTTLNKSSPSQYDNSGDDNELDTSEVTV